MEHANRETASAEPTIPDVISESDLADSLRTQSFHLMHEHPIAAAHLVLAAASIAPTCDAEQDVADQFSYVIVDFAQRLGVLHRRAVKRPLTLLRMVGRQGLYRLCNVIDLIGAIYGISTSLLIMTFIIFDMDAKTFAKAVTILLFVVGSLLAVDGTLSYRTGIDRTWNVTRRGSVATLMGLCKIASTVFGLWLVVIGVRL